MTTRESYIHDIAWKIMQVPDNDFRMINIKKLISEAMIASALDSRMQFPDTIKDDFERECGQ